jgi:hypothetical protein
MSATLPEQEFDNPLDELVIRLEVGMIFGQDSSHEAGKLACTSFESENQSHTSGLNFTLKISIRQNSGAKVFIQWRLHTRGNQLQRH